MMVQRDNRAFDVQISRVGDAQSRVWLPIEQVTITTPMRDGRCWESWFVVDTEFQKDALLIDVHLDRLLAEEARCHAG